MGGRGGGGHSVRERMRADFEALQQHQGQLGPEQQVQKAIRDILAAQGRSGEGRDTAYVSLADVRDRLGMPHSEFDALIRRMSTGHHPVLTSVSQANQKVLTPRQRAGGVSFGGEMAHIVRIT